MDGNLITDTIRYIGDTFGGSGLLIAYFVVKDYLTYKKNSEKKERGEWVDLKGVESKIQESLSNLKSCGFSADKFSEVVAKQSEILTQILYQQKENGGALNRIESKLDRGHT